MLPARAAELQRLRQRLHPSGRLPTLAPRLGQEGQPIGPFDPFARRPHGGQALLELHHPGCLLPQHDEGPATQHPGLGLAERQRLLPRQRQGRLGLPRDLERLPTVLMQARRKDPRQRQARRTGEGVGTSQRLLAPVQGLVGVAEEP